MTSEEVKKDAKEFWKQVWHTCQRYGFWALLIAGIGAYGGAWYCRGEVEKETYKACKLGNFMVKQKVVDKGITKEVDVIYDIKERVQ